MKKETEENIKMVWSIFAIIGIFSTLIFIYDLFDKDDKTTACEEYESKIAELEDKIEDLKDELSIEEDRNRELEHDLEIWKEEYYLLKEAKGCDTGGEIKIPLVDGPASN